MLKFLPKQLSLALQDLDHWLCTNNKHLSITVMGAVAVFAHTQKGRFTQDIDTAEGIEDEAILNQIKVLGKKHGLEEDWLNDRASTVTLPDGALKRSDCVHTSDGMKILVIAREDLIALKAAAFISRGTEVLKDLEDLKQLGPTPKEIQSAISFVEEKFSPPVNKDPWKSQFNESLKVLRGLAD